MIDGVSVCEGFRGYFWHCGCSVAVQAYRIKTEMPTSDVLCRCWSEAVVVVCLCVCVSLC